MARKRWNIAATDKQQALQLAESCGIDPFIAIILMARGCSTPDAVKNFFAGSECLASPFELKDMDRAVSRIQRAIDEFEKISIYGDYDADGITSTALLYSYLTSVGADVSYYIPEREDGYGLSRDAIDKIKEQGTSLIITVDNGIVAADEIAYANGLGIETVVTDHHLPGEVLPPAKAVVDAHRSDCTSHFKGLAGVGVAYKLVCAIESCGCDELLDEYADLVAIGTIADVMPLYDENRVFVKAGINLIQNAPRMGVAALLSAAGIKASDIDSENISYYIAPRINAASRMGKASRAVSLLLSETEDEAMQLAEELCSDNTNRKRFEQEVSAEAIRQIEEKKLYTDRIIVVSGNGWPHGVVGIAASRIMEKYGRPAVIFSVENGEAVGSGRSMKGFNLHQCISSCGDLLLKFGGHELAAGVTIKEDDIDEFRRRVNEYAKNNSKIMPFACIDIDCKLNPAGVGLETVEAMKPLEPFGSSNKRPIFGFFDVKLERITPSSDKKHLRLTFSRGSTSFSLMKFSTTADEFKFLPGDRLDLAVTLAENLYNGNRYLRINLVDMRPAGIDYDEYLRQIRVYECLNRGEDDIDISASCIPDRDTLASIYRYIRSNGEICCDDDSISLRLGMAESYCKVMLALDIMSELGLIEVSRVNGLIKANIININGKVNIDESVLMKRVKAINEAKEKQAAV